jgi:hypothetical protein
MKSPEFLVIMALLWAASASAQEPPTPAAKDDAGQSVYNAGWKDAGGTGFGDWKFQESHGPTDSFAGHFLANTGENPEMAAIAPNGKAFGLYANGSEFESAAAFRAFSSPLPVGSSFSFQMMNGVIEQKGATDNPGAGSIGLTLRNGDAADAPDDYNKGARFEIIHLKGEANYQLYDGEASHDSGVAYSDKGLTVKVTLADADSYDLEITRLADNQMTKLPGRKLGGSGTIDSFCIFDRNGEKADGFFNNFEVVSKAQ